ncbi:MAG: TIGR02301 family protein [Hyphomicrobiales bacterium]|nr:TIGR02301 family protein [Hyphomicrobiales bacterium]
MTGAAGDEDGMGGEAAGGRRLRAAAGLILAATIGLGAARAADEAPYDDKLAELAETLGALHLLRPLCGAPEAQTWRDQMNAVLDAEQPSRERRQRLVDRFNQAYRGLASVHHACTPAARALAEIYRARGEALGRELVSRWGHP